MEKVLRSLETPYIDAQTLLTFFQDYKKPREAILRLVKNGDLIRLKNGVYLITEKIKNDKVTAVPFELVANFLYGPSYVSLEWALSFYGMIPERVHTVTSITLGKNKEYHTSIGDFSYFRLSSRCYSIGIVQKQSSDTLGNFLMASPEKALADLVFKTCKHLDKYQLKEELLESRRMDEIMLRNLNKELLDEIANCYRSKPVDHLREVIGIL